MPHYLLLYLIRCKFIISSTLSCDFRPRTVISDDLKEIYDVFVKLSQKEIESTMGVPHRRPSWILYLCTGVDGAAVPRSSGTHHRCPWVPPLLLPVAGGRVSQDWE